MTRVALYARYSSDQQSAASIEDQLRICRERAERESWAEVQAYEDAAISGASVTLRPGIRRLLRDAERGLFNVVLAEALDRVSRDQADVATLYKHLQFAGVTLVTLAEGEISELHVGLKGTMNALFLKDLARKTHRGLRGRIEKGLSASRAAYGYRIVRRLTGDGELVRGERTIDPAEAAVVRRIFKAFACGTSPRAIARDLNAEGIPGPDGRTWRDTTIRGRASCGTGILNNALYAGVLSWNRKRYLKDPATGRKVARLNPEAEWVEVEVPHLRIVDDALWHAVRAQQAVLTQRFEAATAGMVAARARKFNELRRPVHLLSGLLECGVCGGVYGIVVKDRYGCINRHRHGTCSNPRSIRRPHLEERALAGIRDRLVSPEKVEAAVKAYAQHINDTNRERRAKADTDRQALGKVERAIAGIMAAIEDGMYQPAMKARMAELERQKADITARLSEAPASVPDIHPGIAEVYRRKVERLVETLDDPETRAEAAADIRSLVGKIVLFPGDKRGEVHATLHGELMGILDFVGDDGPDGPQPRRVTQKAVSGSRNPPFSPRPERLCAPFRVCLGVIPLCV
ncbi:recombinase family protein [Sphingosinicella xenopeptidilytica]|uniref:Recombinase family protein n=1 Tax=Sphingosinicella xenopeptidilytica TaxID=364098 RepID=A0ABW3C846_SPHXN